MFFLINISLNFTSTHLSLFANILVPYLFPYFEIGFIFCVDEFLD